MSYKDINNKTGYRNMQGFNYLYGNIKLLNASELTAALADGITSWTAPTPTPPSDAEVLASNKVSKKAAIEADFLIESEQPVLVDTVTWHGGYSSTTKLDSGKRLAELNGDVNVTLYDAVDAPQVLTIAEADVVIIALGGSYQTLFATKQGLLVDIDNAVDQAALDAIVNPWEPVV